MDEQQKSQLRNEINAVLNPPKPDEPVPLPAAAPRARMNAETQEKAFQEWQAFIMAKPANTWSAEERNAIRFASARVLKQLGY